MTTQLRQQDNIGGEVRPYSWQWQDQTYTIATETLGQGRPVLLLPAMSTVSSRSELRESAQRLAAHFQVTAIDWLGFGDSDRPPLQYNPALFDRLLQDFVGDRFTQPPAVLAAGHGAGYALRQSSLWSKLVLVAPTWRGPLPTMGAPIAVASAVRELVRSPLLGQALYQANTTPGFLKLMYGRHVYVDQAKLTPEFIRKKRSLTQQTGARFAPAAFVTGAIDPATNQQEFLNYVQACSAPILTVVAAKAPPKSSAEMAAIAQLPNVQSVSIAGTLGLYEECAIEVVNAALPFLQTA
ncbi:alpha/beta hydrolase [Microcoleus sp. FACHB-1515]|uniref:alpha/beta fold hydrolase n=1 Tax=Cyanophyceae TaxID=3028117 RepID=UPI001687237D|nr:alpha/beta hydrolase [Microcoleus sp. FACHB-1515]MBD2089007.1 alpha/beta hydrolase [Microcoleus sp. FACHB-1515]